MSHPVNDQIFENLFDEGYEEGRYFLNLTHEEAQEYAERYARKRFEAQS